MIIRPATAADAETVADIDAASRPLALPAVRWAHTPADIRGWITGTLVPRGDMWLADQDGIVLGFMALKPGWVDQLYLKPGHWRQGIGSALMTHAKALHRSELQLWCFQCNTRGRAFYESQGFVIAKQTDGQDNEEREPDILYRWSP